MTDRILFSKGGVSIIATYLPRDDVYVLNGSKTETVQLIVGACFLEEDDNEQQMVDNVIYNLGWKLRKSGQEILGEETA